MIRTFKKFHVAALTIAEDFSTLVVGQAEVIAGHLNKTDAKKALAALNVPVAGTEIRFREIGEVTYEMDDETFLKYAHVKE